MSLDQHAHAAAESLHRSSGAGVDTDQLLESLRTTRRRRSAARAVGAACLVVAVVAGGWIGLGPRVTDAAPPVSPTPSPSTLASIPAAANGQIVVRQDLYLRGFDPVTGEPAMVEGLRAPSTAVAAERSGSGGTAWSPDGRTLYYAEDEGVYSLDATDGTKAFVVACDQCGVSASPDGRTLAVAEGGRLKLVDVPTRAVSTLVEDDRGGRLLMPRWSRDGSRIAFIRAEDRGDETHPDRRLAVLETIRSGGTDRRQLVDSAAIDAGLLSSPSWSSDDRTIAVLAVSDGQRREALRVFTVPSAGGAPQELMRVGGCFCVGIAPGLAWSPDGTQLAAVNDEGLVVVPPRAGAVPRLIVRGAWGIPAWRPLPR